MNLPGYRSDDPHDPINSGFHRPESFQMWEDEKDEARVVLSFPAILIRGAGLVALLMLVVWAL
jgi:hypothetical protein